MAAFQNMQILSSGEDQFCREKERERDFSKLAICMVVGKCKLAGASRLFMYESYCTESQYKLR